MESDKRGRFNVSAVHKFDASVTIDGSPKDMQITVIEDNYGNRFYDLAVVKERHPVWRQKGLGSDLDRSSTQGVADENIALDAADVKALDAAVKALDAAVRRIAKRLAPKAGVATGMAGTEAEPAGQYAPALNLIRVALDRGDPAVTVRHEAIHALRAMGLFTEAE